MSGLYFCGGLSKAIAEAVRFLSGKFDGILHELEEKMQAASEALEFEKAIEYRELWNSVKKIAQKQKMTDSHGEDRDVLAAATADEDAVVQVFFIRGGRLIGRDHFYLRITKGESVGSILDSFIKQYYAGTPVIPGELMVQEELEDTGFDRRVAFSKTKRKGQRPCSEERNKRKAGGIGGEQCGNGFVRR